MGVIEWGAVMAFLAVGGLVWKLATRISTVEGKADAANQRADTAGLAVAGNAMKVEKVAMELAMHRESVAKEYVSYVHMAHFENRLLGAFDKLGERIDGLFTRLSAQ